MRRGPVGPGVPMVDAETLVMAVVGPWQYQSTVMGGCWVGSTRYALSQYPPACTTPGTPLPLPTRPAVPATKKVTPKTAV